MAIEKSTADTWTEEQIDALNWNQRNGHFHPFTCGGNRGDAAHKEYAVKNDDRDDGLLVAAADGWRCPVCDYRQNWAHGFMVKRQDGPPGFPVKQ